MHAEEFTTGETVFFVCTYGFCYFEAIWCRMTDGNEQQSSGNVQKPHNSLGSPLNLYGTRAKASVRTELMDADMKRDGI